MLHWFSLTSLLALISMASAEAIASRSPDATTPNDRITMENMTCAFLDHFHVPAEHSPTYQQRYCVYDEYVETGSKKPAPIFFYTGNESPLEQYINNTGLMWELAPEFHAEVIFVEHRYEGQSLPSPSNQNCLSYSSSKQALEDYARFLEYWMLQNATADGHGLLQRRPVISFGGSYGGMLSAWFRMKYPHLVTGAIAASAPIWALPRTNPDRIDGAHQIIHRGLSLPYPPTGSKKNEQVQNEDKITSDDENNHCPDNMLASWPLLTFLASMENTTAANTKTTRATPPLEKHHRPKVHESYPGLAKVSEWFRLCEPLKDPSEVETLMEWIKTPWFDMAEGSFPYASSYIPFSLIKSNGTILKLPPWPLQAACWNESQLHQDWGIRFDGDTSQVNYNVTYGNDSGLTLSIDWDQMIPLNNDSLSWDQILKSSSIEGLLTSVRDSVAVWYNITKEEPCFNLTPAINLEATGLSPQKRGMRKTSRRNKPTLEKTRVEPPTATTMERGLRAVETSAMASRLADLFRAPDLHPRKDDNKNATAECEAYIAGGSWNPLCCNENMNLIIYEAPGMGRDMHWPPSYPKGTTTHADVIQHNDNLANETVPDYCLDPYKIFGYSQLPVDPWATRLDTYYGGTRIESHSNIVFSNGLLDPWTAGGVQVPWEFISTKSYEGPTVIPIGPESHDMIVLLIEFGGHHTDLMYSDEKDPDCVTKARQVEKEYIAKWIEQHA